ncbi:hypothetical protein LEP1GSC133_1623 [Leptospira borgpetersenii serovar Pomona str. 200901868]|uniref:Uncharacterized protein n=2 Tax=Leptospira TaxID=171 RepID=A0AAV9FNR8_LEPIR|nr:hypothetical protein [Leptospira interrogans]EMO62658.1 hypothetical protein LEP1GSC133_1623 [Leptospira borgpetersenii serovar Pomona str. 200901868]KAK2618154.1 hypothetical protein CFV95_003550 [Leptospira interrogans]
MAHVETKIVGQDGDKILYLQFFKDEEPMKNQLWKLQHPGNKTVDSWNESMILRKGEEVSVRTSIRTKNFFDYCVFGVKDPVTDLEIDLAAEYGENEFKKIKQDDIQPRLYGVWQKVQVRFFDGDLWDDVPIPHSEPVSGRNKNGGQEKDR